MIADELRFKLEYAANSQGWTPFTPSECREILDEVDPNKIHAVHPQQQEIVEDPS